MKQTRIHVLALAGALLAFTGCGNKSGSTARALLGLFSKGENTSGAPAQFKAVVTQRFEAAREVAVGQAWLAKFSREAGQSPAATADPAYDLGDSDFTCTGSGTGIFAATPSGTTGTLDIDCTASSSDTFTCGGETFTFHSGTFGLNLDLTATTLSAGVETNGRISGGDLGENVNFVCKFAFSFNLAALSSNPDQAVAADCSNASLSCTVGDENLSCEDLLDAMKENANAQCS